MLKEYAAATRVSKILLIMSKLTVVGYSMLVIKRRYDGFSKGWTDMISREMNNEIERRSDKLRILLSTPEGKREIRKAEKIAKIRERMRQRRSTRRSTYE